MTQRATVAELKNDNIAVVTVVRITACGHNCDSCEGCASVPGAVTVDAENTVGADVGDIVEIETETARVLKLAAFIYIVPVLLMFAGFAALSKISETAGIAGAAAGIAVGLAALVPLNRVLRKNGGMRCRITRIL